MPFDEKSLRRPEFSETDSSPVMMADGREWFFRRPIVRIRPKFSGGKAAKVDIAPYLEGGEQLPALLDAVTGDGDYIQAAMNVGAYLLSFNYDLSDEVLEAIFSFQDDGDDDRMAWLRSIVRIANGADVPKARTSPGDATPSA